MRLFYKNSFCSFLLVFVMILFARSADAQMQSVDSKGNFTSFTPEKTYTDIAKLTALTPLKYRSNPDFGKRVNDSAQWYEQINKRSLKTRTFIGPNKEIIFEDAYDNINYIDEKGWLRAVNTKLKPSSNGWSSEQQEMPVYLYADASTALSLGNKELMVFNKNVHFNQGGIAVNNYTVGDNGMYIKNVAPNTDKIIRVGRGRIETSYTIKQPIKLNGDLVISEDIILPSGYVISESTDVESDGNTGKGLVITGPDGKQAAELKPVLCYENHYKNLVAGVYYVQKQEGGYRLEIQVPSSWLNDPLRQYPVTIDPLLVGGTTMWTGSKIPSCFKPKYGTGKIIDTVPAGITITHFFVQGSWWSPFISKKYFNELFSTRCGSFGPVTVTDTVTLPGLAYGVFDARTPLTCCIKPSCSTDTFSLTMGISRDSAGTDCDSSLYGWYDPGEASLYQGEGYPAVFEAYVMGRTVQDSLLSVTPTSICANQCALTLDADVYYGVPPYKMKEDTSWSTDSVSFGKILGCNIVRGATTLALNIPNCPRPACLDTNMYVPAPTISDACGNVVGGLTSLPITINEVPNVMVIPDTESVCSGSNVNLALSSCVSGSTYTWTGPDGASGSTTPINNIVNNNGTTNITANYTITPSGGGCKGSPSVFSVIVTPFTVNVTPTNPILCEGSSTTLTASGDATQYVWSPSTGLSCTICSSTVANPTVTTTYTVTGTTNAGSCAAFDTAVVVVYPSPTLTVSKDTTIFSGQSALLLSASNDSVTWSPSTGLNTTTGDSVIATPTFTTIYKATATEGPCTISEDVKVTVIEPCEVVHVPSAFTPDIPPNNYLHVLNDGKVSLQEFRVYNRWGEMVFETNDINGKWDGTYNGKAEPVGTYVYYAQVNCEGKTIAVKGDVTLIR